VFLDVLKIEWEYEVQGFETEAGRYLPDFWLPKIATFFEVKPMFSDAYTRDEALLSVIFNRDKEYTQVKRLMSSLVDMSGHRGVIAVGAPSSFKPPVLYECDGPRAFPEYRFSQARIGWFVGSKEMWKAHIQQHSNDRYLYSLLGGLISRTDEAMLQAQQARFEFGESG